MKKNLILAVILTTVVLLNMTSIGFANPFTDIDNNPHKDAILEMSRLGILVGVGNDLFAPNAELNRAAAAKVAGYLLGFTEDDAIIASLKEPVFSDVVGTNHEWALGWINLMAEEGILRGIGEGLYAPGEPLQMVHWVTILTQVLGHGRDNMAWPNDFNDMANFLGLDRGLYYNGASIMNRAQMARMTTTALYKVERADGRRIVDMVTFNEEVLENWHISNAGEPIIYDNANISLKVSNEIVPTGGNQIITITVTATYGENNLPASNTKIEFFANAGPYDRNSQLSTQSEITDENGVAKAFYTTLKSDDNKSIEFVATIHTDDDWINKTANILVSNTSAVISGRVINPFTGEIADDVRINTGSEGYENIHIRPDENGYYRTPVNVGRAYVNFEMNVGDSSPYSGEYSGSHFSIDNNGELKIFGAENFQAGNNYVLQTEFGIITGTSRLAPGSEIYIISSGTNETKIATVADNGRFMITLLPGRYEIYNNVGTVLKSNINIEKGRVTDIGGI